MTLVYCISMTHFYDNCWFSYQIFNLNYVGNFRLLNLWFDIETMCLQCVKTHVTGSASIGSGILWLQDASTVNCRGKGIRQHLTAEETSVVNSWGNWNQRQLTTERHYSLLHLFFIQITCVYNNFLSKQVMHVWPYIIKPWYCNFTIRVQHFKVSHLHYLI